MKLPACRLRVTLLLFGLAAAATVLILRARGVDSDRNFVSDHARDRSRKTSASRNLMSEGFAVQLSPKLATVPVVATPPETTLSFKVLLQKSTSRLVCKSKNSAASDLLPAPNAMVMDKYSTKRTGYVLVTSFREQQTKASDNLFGLQCWAKTLFVNIVEPFIENSHFVVPLSSDQSNLLRYRDIFDLDVWQLLTMQHRFAPLASWATFLGNAPRELIVVRFKYLSAKMSKKRKSSNESVTHFAVTSSYKEGCDVNMELSRKIQYLMSEHNFTVVRKVCFNFALGDELTLLQFNRHLYGGLSPNAVTVLMEEWRGLGSLDNGKRVVLLNACLPSKYVQSVTYTWPSQQLICNAKKYRQKYLKTANYISLMVRTEKILSLNSSRDFMANCLNETLKSWRALVDATGMTTTFLAMDIGSYGSDSLVEQNSNSKYYPFLDIYEVFLRELFGPRATIKTWESGFETVAVKRDLGYIGSLQKTLAAQSRCMVLSGGGTFQKHAQHIYNRINHGRKKPCVKVLHKCSRGLL